jgi:uncharacterized protein
MDPETTLSAVAMAERLDLQPHPEGGFFRETFRAPGEAQTPRGPRAPATAILFLLADGSPSRFHRLSSQELWLHQAGAPVELIMLPASAGLSSSEAVVLGAPEAVPGRGPSTAGGCWPQALVPADVWQAARVVRAPAGPAWGLLACIVVPGFDYADFELAERAALMLAFPEQAALIRALT